MPCCEKHHLLGYRVSPHGNGRGDRNRQRAGRPLIREALARSNRLAKTQRKIRKPHLNVCWKAGAGHFPQIRIVSSSVVCCSLCVAYLVQKLSSHFRFQVGVGAGGCRWGSELGSRLLQDAEFSGSERPEALTSTADVDFDSARVPPRASAVAGQKQNILRR